MNIKHHTKMSLLLLFFLAGTISSCKKYLEIAPNKSSSVQVKTTADLDGLLNNTATFAVVNTGDMFATDDYGLTGQIYKNTQLANSIFFTNATVYNATWDRIISAGTNNAGWTSEYQKIFVANLVLTSLDKVSGSEGDKAALAAEAHFVRAYSYWQLANDFCLPYTGQNGNEMGLPIKLTTSFDENVERSTLAEVYSQIEQDLGFALAGVNSTVMQNGKLRNWRANTAAVHCFAARYYLGKGDYLKALDEANLSLTAHSELINYNDPAQAFVTVNSRYNINAGSTDPAYPAGPFDLIVYNVAIDQPYINKEFTYVRTQQSNFPVVSSELLSLYGSNDRRTDVNLIEGMPVFLLGLASYPAQTASAYVSSGLTTVNCGPSVPEAILTKAEAQARLGMFSEALGTVNILRAKRINPTATGSNPVTVNLTAATQQEAITKILQERRREMPLGLRWFDMRRFNNNNDANDDVIPTRDFFDYSITTINTAVPKTYTLERNSRKYAFPIPFPDIVASNGAIKQNIY
jgi:hypothetical protein